MQMIHFITSTRIINTSWKLLAFFLSAIVHQPPTTNRRLNLTKLKPLLLLLWREDHIIANPKNFWPQTHSGRWNKMPPKSHKFTRELHITITHINNKCHSLCGPSQKHVWACILRKTFWLKNILAGAISNSNEALPRRIGKRWRNSFLALSGSRFPLFTTKLLLSVQHCSDQVKRMPNRSVDCNKNNKEDSEGNGWWEVVLFNIRVCKWRSSTQNCNLDAE